MHIGYWWESQKKRDHWEDQGVGGLTILNGSSQRLPRAMTLPISVSLPLHPSHFLAIVFRRIPLVIIFDNQKNSGPAKTAQGRQREATSAASPSIHGTFFRGLSVRTFEELTQRSP
jgi:hypothetical protein